MTAIANSIDQTIIVQATPEDVAEILALQKVAYQSEAEIYGDESVPALQQSLAELREDFQRMVFLKAVVNGKIIGAVRGYSEGDTAHILRLIVHPYFQGRGIGRRLVKEIEAVWPPAIRRFEAFTGHKSKRNLALYGLLGYRPFKEVPHDKAVTWVYMEKMRHES
ncbi:GNAT family N-acetyltransferase [Fontisphaera persica]|jgi:ribosomal protein S18 acetylase RimI-like enzyme|uniref:GNAT family N-acetyltransferase n=1 Tax=Fontisphaera persica TaxID=2974023 RepID=UPI0024C01C75|nr:GNAT family N-acetyltransferase [Fontisphaera persica]WCJ61201.1 GNAT family N-acetyltransferase [Fontisphaera persica]